MSHVENIEYKISCEYPETPTAEQSISIQFIFDKSFHEPQPTQSILNIFYSEPFNAILNRFAVKSAFWNVWRLEVQTFQNWRIDQKFVQSIMELIRVARINSEWISLH